MTDSCFALDYKMSKSSLPVGNHIDHSSIVTHVLQRVLDARDDKLHTRKYAKDDGRGTEPASKALGGQCFKCEGLWAGHTLACVQWNNNAA